MNDGRIVESGTVTKIFTNPKSAVTRDFLSHLSSGDAGQKDDGIVRWSKAGGEYTLRFIGNKTGEPLISTVSKKFDVEFNIRAGGIQTLSNSKEVGTLIVDIDGKEKEVQKAVEYIRKAGVTVELTNGDEK